MLSTFDPDLVIQVMSSIGGDHLLFPTEVILPKPTNIQINLTNVVTWFIQLLIALLDFMHRIY